MLAVLLRIGIAVPYRYCILGYDKISAWRARGARARVSINFRKFSPCMAHARRARRARGFDTLPSLSDVGTVSFR